MAEMSANAEREFVDAWQSSIVPATTGFAKLRVQADTRVPVKYIVPLRSLPERLLVLPQEERVPLGPLVMRCPWQIYFLS